MMWVILHFFCYIDGVYTIIDMATAYGTALGLADGIIWQFWRPVEWFRLFGELLLAWGIVLILAFAFSLAKKNI